MVANMPAQLSNSTRNLGFQYENQLKLKVPLNSVKNKVIVNLASISRQANFIEKKLENETSSWA